MSITYNVYKNDGLGGPVDYSTPVATASGLSYAGAALAVSSDTTFAVRATDGTTEESNVDCRVRVVIDAAGVDVSAVPSPPAMLSASPTASAGILAHWFFVADPASPTPAGFKVWATVGTSVDYTATPDATVPFVPRLARYSAAVAGLTSGTTYAVGVRAYNAVGAEANTLKVAVTPVGSAPAAVSALSGSAAFTP